jgi:hypothetical protein
MLKLVRNHDGTYDLITAKGVVLLHEETAALCRDVKGYLDGTKEEHLFTASDARAYGHPPYCANLRRERIGASDYVRRDGPGEPTERRRPRMNIYRERRIVDVDKAVYVDGKVTTVRRDLLNSKSTSTRSSGVSAIVRRTRSAVSRLKRAAWSLCAD